MNPGITWRWGSILLFLAGILTIGLYFFLVFVPGEREAVLRGIQVRLRETVGERTGVLETWLRDGLATTEVVASSATVGHLLVEGGDGPAPRIEHLHRDLRVLLQPLLAGGRFCDAAVLDPRGRRVVAAVGAPPCVITDAAAAARVGSGGARSRSKPTRAAAAP